jgi:hypothetical protein
MKPRPGEIGTYNPVTMEYEACLTPEERQEEFNEEHANDPVGIEPTEPPTMELLPPEEQADTWNPYLNKFVKAGSPIDKGEDR